MRDNDATDTGTDNRTVEVKLVVDDDAVSLWWDDRHIAEFGREWYEQAKARAQDEDRPVEDVVSQAVDEYAEIDIAEVDWVR